MNEFCAVKYHAKDDTTIRVKEWKEGIGEWKEGGVFFTLDIGELGSGVTIFTTPHFLSRLAETLSKYRGVEEQIALRGIVEGEKDAVTDCP